ncbi:hypothetical protein AMS68_001731 [Peltaster fructicola]|uniref:Uncharacterized protein n=1 Tax=Peltaster fructicola TaxID=286661 RepID=A0A6H0XNC0_9PEZI|nr:hypothetical protein AMS68_001731 [Peltaster fructicola]
MDYPRPARSRSCAYEAQVPETSSEASSAIRDAMKGVYHINAGLGSFTTSNIESLMDRTRYDHETSNDRTNRPESTISSGLSAEYQLLSQQMPTVTTMLHAAGQMVLSRARLDIADSQCKYRGCCYKNQMIWGGQLYLHIELVDMSYDFHLTCLEDLWNGKGCTGRLPNPELFNEEWYDELLHEHSSRPGHNATGADSPVMPVCRSQYLAEFIVTTPGSNMEGYEKDIVLSWKQASREQIERPTAAHHKEQLRKLVAIAAAEDAKEQSEEKKEMTLMHGCFGKNLSQVLQLSL